MAISRDAVSKLESAIADKISPNNPGLANSAILGFGDSAPPPPPIDLESHVLGFGDSAPPPPPKNN